MCADGECALAEALKKLMLDDDLREQMGIAARQEMKKYAPKNIWQQWDELIREVGLNTTE